MTKLRLVCAAAFLAATASGTALADASANIGLMSEYIFRGVYQSDASAFAGLDIDTDSGFYMGTWGIDVSDGLEYDIYLGYRGGGDMFKWYAGLQGYYYSDTFDHSYEEYQLGFSYGVMTIDYALGEYHVQYAGDARSQPVGPTPEESGGGILITNGNFQTYQYLGATFEPKVGPYYFIGHTDYKNVQNTGGIPGRIANTGKDGYWVEIGKHFEVMDNLDIGIAALYSFDIPTPDSMTPSSVQLSAANPWASYAAVLTITKTIPLMGK